MSIQLEVSIKVQVVDGAPDHHVRPRGPGPDITGLLSKIASLPWVAVIVREWMRNE